MSEASDTNGNGNGTPNFFADTVNNMARVLPELRIQDGEDIRKHARRVADFLCARWAMNWSTYRGLKVMSGGRRPNLRLYPAFFEDLEKYGRVQFGPKGGVVKETIGRGPDVKEYLHLTSPQ